MQKQKTRKHTLGRRLLESIPSPTVKSSCVTTNPLSVFLFFTGDTLPLQLASVSLVSMLKGCRHILWRGLTLVLLRGLNVGTFGRPLLSRCFFLTFSLLDSNVDCSKLSKLLPFVFRANLFLEHGVLVTGGFKLESVAIPLMKTSSDLFKSKLGVINTLPSDDELHPDSHDFWPLLLDLNDLDLPVPGDVRFLSMIGFQDFFLLLLVFLVVSRSLRNFCLANIILNAGKCRKEN